MKSFDHLIQENWRLTMQKSIEIFSIIVGCCDTIIHDKSQFHKSVPDWVPKQLSAGQKTKRVKIHTALWKHYEQEEDRFL